jgi:hypothetical protein
MMFLNEFWLTEIKSPGGIEIFSLNKKGNKKVQRGATS